MQDPFLSFFLFFVRVARAGHDHHAAARGLFRFFRLSSSWPPTPPGLARHTRPPKTVVRDRPDPDLAWPSGTRPSGIEALRKRRKKRTNWTLQAVPRWDPSTGSPRKRRKKRTIEASFPRPPRKVAWTGAHEKDDECGDPPSAGSLCKDPTGKPPGGIDSRGRRTTARADSPDRLDMGQCPPPMLASVLL